MFIVFFGSCIIKDSPLNAVQMLWVNLVMDTLGALSLATEPPAHNVLEKQPYPKDDPIVNEVMWRNIFGHAIIQIIILNLIIFGGPHFLGLCQPYGVLCLKHDANKNCISYNPYFATSLYQTDETISNWNTVIKENFGAGKHGKWDPNAITQFRCDFQNEDPKYKATPCDAKNLVAKYAAYDPSNLKEGDETQKIIHFTFVFQIFVFLQLFNQINSRKIELGEKNVFSNFFSNWAFITVWVIEWVTQISMVQIGGVITKCHALDTKQNLFCLGLGLISLPWGFILKFIPLKYFQCISIDDKVEE